MFMDHRLDLWTGHAEKMMQNMMVAVMTDTNQEIADIKKNLQTENDSLVICRDHGRHGDLFVSA